MDARVSVVDSRCAGPPLSKLGEISLNMALEESSKYYLENSQLFGMATLTPQKSRQNVPSKLSG